jgi:hypothetical protein
MGTGEEKPESLRRPWTIGQGQSHPPVTSSIVPERYWPMAFGVELELWGLIVAVQYRAARFDLVGLLEGHCMTGCRA